MKPPAKRRGRPPLEDARDDLIKIRSTAEEKAKFHALGGPDWFRRALKRAKVEGQ